LVLNFKSSPNPFCDLLLAARWCLQECLGTPFFPLYYPLLPPEDLPKVPLRIKTTSVPSFSPCGGKRYPFLMCPSALTRKVQNVLPTRACALSVYTQRVLLIELLCHPFFSAPQIYSSDSMGKVLAPPVEMSPLSPSFVAPPLSRLDFPTLDWASRCPPAFFFTFFRSQRCPAAFLTFLASAAPLSTRSRVLKSYTALYLFFFFFFLYQRPFLKAAGALSYGPLFR